MRPFKRLKRPVLILFCAGTIVALIIVMNRAITQTTLRFHRQSLVDHSMRLEILPPAIIPQQRSTTPFLLVIISSSPNGQNNAERRNAIRRTWGRYTKPVSPRSSVPDWDVVFMMGKTYDAIKDKQILKESSRYRDLLIVDFKDTYRNITEKLLTSLEWASRTKYSYVLKTDDDVYVNIPGLVRWLLERGQVERFYGGVLYEGPVVRNKNHRHFVSEKELNLARYPTFCKGSLYVLSWDLVPKIVQLSRKIRRITPDDAYVGLLANALYVEPVRINSFIQLKLLHFFIEMISGCELQRIIGFADSLSARQMHYLHHQLSVIKGRSQFCIPATYSLMLVIALCVLCLYNICRRRGQLLKVFNVMQT